MNAPLRRVRAVAPPPIRPDTLWLSKHQAFIRALPCLTCDKPAPSECAHIRSHAGIGLSSDPYLVPLCGPATVWDDCCHSQKHYLGTARFWARLGIDPHDFARRLWRVSGDLAAGVRVVMRARQRSAATRYRRTGGTGSSSPGWGDPVGALGKSRPAAMPQAQASGQVVSWLERGS
jgi:hypothetical protein